MKRKFKKPLTRTIIAAIITVISLHLTSSLLVSNQSSRSSEFKSLERIEMESFRVPLLVLGCISGVLAKSLWDAEELKQVIHLSALKPLLVSPIIALALIGEVSELPLTHAYLLCFKNGFFWQTLLVKNEPTGD